MRKIILVCVLLLTAVIAGCSSGETENTYQDAQLDSNGNVTINADQITDTATFINYDAEGTTVQLFAVKASDGTVRLALNTCQSCNPSPMAYFVQDGESFVCQNCGTSFTADQVGLATAGCNPTNIGSEEEDGVITILGSDLIRSAQLFTYWQGPVS